jgi:hypothetical protein
MELVCGMVRNFRVHIPFINIYVRYVYAWKERTDAGKFIAQFGHRSE